MASTNAKQRQQTNDRANAGTHAELQPAQPNNIPLTQDFTIGSNGLVAQEYTKTQWRDLAQSLGQSVGRCADQGELGRMFTYVALLAPIASRLLIIGAQTTGAADTSPPGVALAAAAAGAR